MEEDIEQSRKAMYLGTDDIHQVYEVLVIQVALMLIQDTESK
jgi:hypothetical protein